MSTANTALPNPTINPVDLDHIKALAYELIEDNPMAIRALLRLVSIEASTEVPTAAVTRSASPRLLVNLDFIARHCHTDQEIKALILHEYLHVLLGHTDLTEPLTPNLHLALDAVINAMIHRQLGPEYSSFMSRFYAKAEGVWRWLRPPDGRERMLIEHALPTEPDQLFLSLWNALYSGRLVVADLREVGDTISPMLQISLAQLMDYLLGDHQALEEGAGKAGNEGEGKGELPQGLKDALDEVRKALGPNGLFGDRKAGSGGPVESLHRQATTAESTWRCETHALLKRMVVTNPGRGIAREAPSVGALPVLSTSDRRGVLKSLWSPHLPMNEWVVQRPVKSGAVQVYLDVSGSMNNILPPLLDLLRQFGPVIERPFWGFSTVVRPAKLKDGGLLTQTSGGTSIDCVLAHIAQTNPKTALIVTDGEFRAMDSNEVALASVRRKVGEVLNATKVWGLLTPRGCENALERMGVEVVRLGGVRW